MADFIMNLAIKKKTPREFHVILKLPQLSIDKDEFT